MADRDREAEALGEDRGRIHEVEAEEVVVRKESMQR